jgi:hypothetical protein
MSPYRTSPPPPTLARPGVRWISRAHHPFLIALRPFLPRAFFARLLWRALFVDLVLGRIDR